MHALKQTNIDNSFYFMIFILALNLQVFLQVTTDLVNIYKVELCNGDLNYIHSV